jgi:hypothetical protein
VSSESHTLILELLGDVPRSRSRHFDPSLGEDGTGSDDKGDVNDGVERIREGGFERVRSGNVVCDTGDGRQLGRRILERLRSSVSFQ